LENAKKVLEGGGAPDIFHAKMLEIELDSRGQEVFFSLYDVLMLKGQKNLKKRSSVRGF
jgi:hypothetical protein